MTATARGISPHGDETDPTSRTEGLLHSLRSMPLMQQVVPMEAQISWPVPVRHKQGWDGRPAVFLRLLMFGFRRPDRRGDPSLLYPPFAMLTLNWANGSPVEYVDLRYSRPWPMDPPLGPVGQFPHPEVATMSVGEYTAARQRLCELYDGLFESLAGGPAFDDRAEFSELLERLMEPSLVPYYRSAAPKFVDAFLGSDPTA